MQVNPLGIGALDIRRHVTVLKTDPSGIEVWVKGDISMMSIDRSDVLVRSVPPLHENPIRGLRVGDDASSIERQ